MLRRAAARGRIAEPPRESHAGTVAVVDLEPSGADDGAEAAINRRVAAAEKHMRRTVALETRAAVAVSDNAGGASARRVDCAPA